MKTTHLILTAGLVLSAALAPAQVARPQPPPGGRPVATGHQGRHEGRELREGGRRGPKRGSERVSREDQRLLEKLEDSPDFRELKRLYPQAVASQSAEVRWALVAELESQGEHGVNMLAPLIADRNEEVADAAYQAWTSAVQEMGPRRRAEAFVEAGAVLSQMRGPQGANPAGPVPVAPMHPQPVR